MNVPTKDDLHDLIEKEDRASISIYLPTFRAGKEVAQNSIRFKNLLRKAEENLRETGIKPASELQKLLKPAERLLANDFFWRNQSDGLAVFLSSDEFRDYRVPMHFDELVVVASRFHIKPLLTMLAADGRFYLLALSQNDVRLFQGTHYAVTEIEPDDLGIPKSLTDITQLDFQRKSCSSTPVHRPGKVAEMQSTTGLERAITTRRTLFFATFEKLTRVCSPFLQRTRHLWCWPEWTTSFPSFDKRQSLPRSSATVSWATRKN